MPSDKLKSKKLNIWLIKIGELPIISKESTKARNYFISQELIKKGHSVTHFISEFNHFTKKHTSRRTTLISKKNYKCVLLKSLGYKKNISLRRYIDHKLLSKEFLKTAEKLPLPDIILCGTPPHNLAYTALKFSKKHNIPFILDIRDLWPDIFLDRFPKFLSPLLKIFLYGDFKKSEYIIKNSDAITAVSSSMSSYTLKKSDNKRIPNKIFYIGYNEPKTNSLKNSKNKNLVLTIPKNKFIATYIGSFGLNADPSIIIKAAKILEKDFHFIIIGQGGSFEKIKNFISSKKIKNISLTGWIPQSRISQILKQSHIGLCPTSGTGDFMPNKIFAYLSEGKPIISAYDGELKSIIEKNKIGLNYSKSDLEEFMFCLNYLKDNSPILKNMSKNARKIYKERFALKNIYSAFSDYIIKIHEDYKKSNEDYKK